MIYLTFRFIDIGFFHAGLRLYAALNFDSKGTARIVSLLSLTDLFKTDF